MREKNNSESYMDRFSLFHLFLNYSKLILCLKNEQQHPALRATQRSLLSLGTERSAAVLRHVWRRLESLGKRSSLHLTGWTKLIVFPFWLRSTNHNCRDTNMGLCCLKSIQCSEVETLAHISHQQKTST